MITMERVVLIMQIEEELIILGVTMQIILNCMRMIPKLLNWIIMIIVGLFLKIKFILLYRQCIDNVLFTFTVENVINTEKAWLVNFYSPMCSHCHTLAPVWRKIAEEFDGVVRIGAVNCEDEWHLCHQIRIQSYPTLMYYPKACKFQIIEIIVKN